MADTKQQAPDLPVYLFTGFLEAGKTKFIQETLEDERFHKGERTLLLLCEEGEEVYEPDKFCAGNVFVRNIDCGRSHPVNFIPSSPLLSSKNTYRKNTIYFLFERIKQ